MCISFVTHIFILVDLYLIFRLIFCAKKTRFSNSKFLNCFASSSNFANFLIAAISFTGTKMFCTSPNFLSQPKNLTASRVPLQNLFCWHKNQFYWMQIIFLSSTKCLWLPQGVENIKGILAIVTSTALCLVLLQVAKCFVPVHIFCVGPKIYLHIVPVTTILC